MDRRAALRLLAAAAVLPVALAACGDTARPSRAGEPATRLRLGYFANVTHATALVGVGKGFFAGKLGGTRLETQVFNAGPSAIEALFAGSIDAAYIGPNPAINAYAKSKGDALRIVAGATSGGASLVVRKGLAASDLRGRKLATPQLGNTQDVALRAWLAEQGLRTVRTGRGGDVTIVPSENATTLELFRAGKLDGAWVPEPWASRLVLEGGGEVLLDERALWPGGRFVTTHLVVAREFLEEQPQAVKALVQGSVAADAWIAANPDEARTAVNAELKRLTGKQLADDVIRRAFANLEVTYDPVASSLVTSADHAVAAGLLKKPDLAGIYDLRLLNEVLAAAGKPAVADAGLGRK